jgi:hypothetical protein
VNVEALTKVLADLGVAKPDKVTYEFLRSTVPEFESIKKQVLHFDASILDEDPRAIGY